MYGFDILKIACCGGGIYLFNLLGTEGDLSPWVVIPAIAALGYGAGYFLRTGLKKIRRP